MSKRTRNENSSHVMKQNVMKEEFGWEVPIESVPLPSKGLIYSPDTTLYNREVVPIRAMTAQEEDILTSQAFIKEGTVVNRLISSCVTDKSFRVDDLTIGDRNALMIAVRVTGYGPDYKVLITCDSCDHKNDITINLSDLTIKRLEIEPTAPGKNEFEFILPVTKKKITFKFLTIADEQDRSTANKNEQAAFKTKLEKNVTSYLKYTIQSVGNITDKNKIHHFVTYMPAYDSKTLRNFINKHEPGMDMGAHCVCEKCGYNNDFTLPITSEFFWPST